MWIWRCIDHLHLQSDCQIFGLTSFVQRAKTVNGRGAQVVVTDSAGRVHRGRLLDAERLEEAKMVESGEADEQQRLQVTEGRDTVFIGSFARCAKSQEQGRGRTCSGAQRREGS
jgi:hypothetical protein